MSEELKKDARAKAAFDVRVDDLRQHGVGSDETQNFCPHIKDGIYKLKIRNKPQLRPHLCKGPEKMDSEATFLVWAIEENSKLDPPNVLQIAAERRAVIKRDPERKRPI